MEPSNIVWPHCSDCPRACRSQSQGPTSQTLQKGWALLVRTLMSTIISHILENMHFGLYGICDPLDVCKQTLVWQLMGAWFAKIWEQFTLIWISLRSSYINLRQFMSDFDRIMINYVTNHKKYVEQIQGRNFIDNKTLRAAPQPRKGPVKLKAET